VRLSRELERDAIDAGFVAPWQHSNAKRCAPADRKPYRPRKLTSRAPRCAGQIELFPELRPVARFHAFGGGYVPPAVALEIEYRRKRLGLTQRQLGDMIGVGQSQIANVLRGHDPISRLATNRLRKILLKQPAE
jgi:hypothetical protein